MNQSIAHSVAKNTAVQMFQQLMTWASSFLLMLFLPRLLGPVNYGRLYLAMSTSAIFLMFVDYDGRIGIAKRIARSREATAQIAANAIGFRILFWCAAFAGLMTFAFVADYPPTVRILFAIFAVEMSWIGLRTVLWGTFLGHEIVTWSTVGNIVERAFIAGAGITALLLGAGVVGVALIMVTGTLINTLLCIRYGRRLVTHLPRVDWREARAMVREGVPYLLWTVFGVVYYRIDGVMLSLMTPEAVVGWYGASYKFFDVLAFLPSIYSLSILPVLSRLWGKEDDTVARTTRKSLEFILIAGIPISILVFTFAPLIITFFFGLAGYAPSILNLRIFASGLLLIYIDMVLSTALFACDRQKAWAAVAFLAVIVNVGLNFYLIPMTQARFANGGVGASIATIATEFFIMLSALAIMPKRILDGASVAVPLRALAAGAAMAAACWLMEGALVPWYAALPAACAVYGAALLSMKTFQPSELAFMKNFLSPKNLRSTFATNKGGNA